MHLSTLGAPRLLVGFSLLSLSAPALLPLYWLGGIGNLLAISAPRNDRPQAVNQGPLASRTDFPEARSFVL